MSDRSSVPYDPVKGEWSQSLVDIEISDERAAQAGQRLASWLIERRIVSAEVTNCVLDVEGGHPPGENYGYAIGNPSAETPRFWTNGVAIHVGRKVYWNSEFEAVTCPHCGYRESMMPRELGRWDTAFEVAISDWSGGGAGLVRCLRCGADNTLNDWDWGYPWAFGALGVTFWNWHQLADTFVAEVSELVGHRLVYNSHKL